MRNSPKSDSSDHRTTLGFLTASVHLPNDELLWSGVCDAAEKHAVNLITFAGGQLHPPDRFMAQANVLYDLVSRQHLDGLLIWSCTVGWYLTQEELAAFFKTYHPLPCVSVEDVVDGFPSVLKDNYGGMRDAIIHLIDVHHYRRIAFLKGPSNILWAQERYRAYIETLSEYGLPYEPNLIVPFPESEHFEGTDTGAATRQLAMLFDERTLRPTKDVDVIVAATDHLAHEAIIALQARGLRIPQDIAVIGFDDEQGSRVTTPPLTTVRNPIYEMGWQAVERLLALLRGEDGPEHLVIPTTTIIRQSCGCQSPSILQAEADMPEYQVAASAMETSWSACTGTKCVFEMMQAINISGEHGERERVSRVLESFLEDVNRESPGKFLSTLNDVIFQADQHGIDVLTWQDVISRMRRYTLPRLDTPAAILRAENLWGQARILIGEIAQQVQARRIWQAEQQAQIVHGIEPALITAFDIERLIDILHKGFPLLKIPGCYLCLYEDPENPTEAARLILAYDEDDDRPIAPAQHIFPSAALLSEGILSPERRVNVLAVPLFFQEQSLGFAVFTVGPPDGRLYETLRQQMSTALNGANLIHHIQEHSAELARKNYILDTFMANVPDTIYFKDRESRILHANKAHAARLGLHDPAEEIGKTDFDFFPDDVARSKYEQEQEIIRSGQPLLNLEEPTTKESWVLTTKMPLRDEHGEIIGTFGISHDITELKHTQMALEQAYAAVEQRVVERTAELQHEIAERVRTEAELQHLKGYLQNIIDSMPAVLMSVDTHGKITHWNREAANITGLTADDVQGHLLSDAFPPLAPQMPRIWQALREQALQKDIRLTQPSGCAMRYADVTVYPLIANGTEGAVVILEDVTERIRIEERILQTEKMMIVRGLAAGMAHEINNPLNVILQGMANIQRRFSIDIPKNKAVANALGTRLEIIGAYLDQQHIAQYFDLIQESALQAAQIVDNMRMFSHNASSAMMPDDLNSIMERAIDLATHDYDVKSAYDFHKITLVREYDSKLPKVLCISTEIQQVLLNILRNAVQAMTEVHPEAPSPCIHLTTRQESEYVRIDIADNGPGMTEDVRKRVFEPFFTTRTVRGGTGLGLSVSYFIIVAHHHGQFFVNSIPGTGTTFTILLPILSVNSDLPSG